MSLILGIDTGGTYTDAVLIDPKDKKILSKAKAPTTKDDLTKGISNCLNMLGCFAADAVKLVCLSTTLATNALVEGRGGKAGLIIIGKRPEGSIPADHIVLIKGRQDIKGRIREETDDSEILDAAEKLRQSGASAIAVSGYASVRNPKQELHVKRIITDSLNIPVICAHELTADLGFYDRTITVTINARLIPVIRELVSAVKNVLARYGINAQLMIVKGDGSLMHEGYAAEKPVDTILSGPAASIIGAVFLTGVTDALVIDMGGTTTDIAVVVQGRARLSQHGATVAGWMTQVKAAKISTFGIGGDSHIRIAGDDIKIGPQRVLPLCVAGRRFPHLSAELESASKQETDCYLLMKRPESFAGNIEEKIADVLAESAHSVSYIAKTLGLDEDSLGLEHMVDVGILQRISVTPTDILRVLGIYNHFDVHAAKTGIKLLAEKANQKVLEFANKAYETIVGELAECCLQAGAEYKGFERIVGIGAPACTWIPVVCKKLKTSCIIPEHAEVANAAGAAVGQVMESAQALIRPGIERRGFILHAPWGCADYESLEQAAEDALAGIESFVEEQIIRAGGGSFETAVTRDDIYTDAIKAGEKTFIETRIVAVAVASPVWRE